MMQFSVKNDNGKNSFNHYSVVLFSYLHLLNMNPHDQHVTHMWSHVVTCDPLLLSGFMGSGLEQCGDSHHHEQYSGGNDEEAAETWLHVHWLDLREL